LRGGDPIVGLEIVSLTVPPRPKSVK
jgi:hypothetical protein